MLQYLARICKERFNLSQSIEEIFEKERNQFRGKINQLIQSGILEEHMGRIWLSDTTLESFETHRIAARFETRSFTLNLGALHSAIMKSILLLKRVTLTPIVI